MEVPKKKKKVLTNNEKMNIIEKLDRDIPPAEISSQYGVSRTFVYSLKGKKEKLRALAKTSSPQFFKQKNSKTAKNEELDKATYMWFRQKRTLGEPISGPLLCEKALILNEKLSGDRTFKASHGVSHGWLNNFKRRHGIHHLSVQGKKLSSDTESAKTFVDEFKKFVEDNGYAENNVYNADESGLNYRSLPQKTLACHDENTASGRKVNKDRVTAMFCANASGSHKIPILIIGKYKKPRCFKNVTNLPVCYKAQSSAWMDRSVFLEWYAEEFIPAVKAEMKKRNEDGKVLLLLDNAPSHPSVDVLNAVDENFSVMYLPPNVTAIIQPMDQGVIETVKKLYRKSLARGLLLYHEGRVEDFVKSLSLIDCCNMIAEAWENVTSYNLSKAWKAFFPHTSTRVNDENSDAGIRRQQNETVADTNTMFSQIEQLDVSENEILSWINEDCNLPGWETLSDGTIIGTVQNNNAIVSSQADCEKQSVSDFHEPCRIVSAICDVVEWVRKAGELYTGRSASISEDPKTRRGRAKSTRRVNQDSHVICFIDTSKYQQRFKTSPRQKR